MSDERNRLGCLNPECNKRSRWHIWFAGWPLYGSVCDDHAIEYLRDGKDGWPTVCLRTVQRIFLEDDDPVLLKETEEEERDRLFYESRQT